MSTVHNRCVALAGAFQAATEVRRIGREGNVGSAALTATVGSVFILDPETPVQVYGGLLGLHSGLPVLRNFLQNQTDRATVESARYALALMRLERKLHANRDALEGIRHDLTAIMEQHKGPVPIDDRTLKQLADVYLRRVSDLGPRIMVKGEPAYLNAPGNPERIRALLLGGIRAIFLWRQLGGNRINLFLGRAGLLRAADDLRRRAASETIPRSVD